MSEDSSKKTKTEANHLTWWEGLCAALGAYIMSIAAVVLVSQNLIEGDSAREVAIIHGLSSVSMLAFAALYLRIRGVSIRGLLGRLRTKWILLVPIFYLIYVAFSMVSQYVVELLPWVNIAQEQNLGLDNFTNADLPLIFVSLVILPPLAEELVFRGILYKSFKWTFGRMAAALITSALFGLAHGQWNVAADTFVLSLVLIVLVERSKSLWPAITLHALKNLIAFLLVFIF